MKHPDREEWVPFIFGEAAGESKKRLADHLRACPECAQIVGSWRRSLSKLDEWDLPRRNARERPSSILRPAFKFAWAAVLLLFAGVLIGRVTASRTDRLPELKAAVEASVRANLGAEMRMALQEMADRTSNFVAASEVRLSQETSMETQRVWRNVLDVLQTTRAENGQATQALFNRYQNRYDQELISLRKDLETLASMTDDELRQARFKLIQLAANTAAHE